ncbi:MAG: hypothetical protein GY810_00420 [Aureispira sp.]|nr:hypothetical protein [Aureispira sp.]
MKDKISVFELIALIGGLITILVSIAYYVKARKTISTGTHTIGKVIKCKHYTADDVNGCKITIRYDAYEATLEVMYMSDCVKGKELEVVYDPKKPKNVYLNNSSPLGYLLAFSFMGLMFMALGSLRWLT